MLCVCVFVCNDLLVTGAAAASLALGPRAHDPLSEWGSLRTRTSRRKTPQEETIHKGLASTNKTAAQRDALRLEGQ